MGSNGFEVGVSDRMFSLGDESPPSPRPRERREFEAEYLRSRLKLSSPKDCWPEEAREREDTEERQRLL